MNSFVEIEFLDKVGTLSSVEARYHVKIFVLKCQRGMEVASGVQVGDLGPSITDDIVNFALVHRFWRQT